MISLKVPGRVCFFGDHQDYLRLPVIAGTINRFLYLEANPINTTNFQVELSDTQEGYSFDLSFPLSQKPKNYFESGLKYIQNKGARFSQGYAIRIWSEIPIKAGLSSSSALVVAWLRFLLEAQKDIPFPNSKTLGHLAYEVEVLAFDQPGGLMDQYTIAQGGLLYIDTDSQQSHSLPLPNFHWVVAESGIEKETLEVLQNAKKWQQKAIATFIQIDPNFDIRKSTPDDYYTYLESLPLFLHNHWYACLHNYAITLDAQASFLKNPTPEVLGSLMLAHQEILTTKIQNTPPALIAMLEAAQAAGAYGSKIIGSGGGGCLVALVESAKKQTVIEAFLAHGAKKAYEVIITPTYESQ